ncbi:MAG: hypothetical protein QM775_03165 [Pirellulales bacterium]
MDDVSKRNQFFEGPGDAGFEFQYRNNTNGQFYGRVQTNNDFVIRSGNDNTAAGTWVNLQYTWDFTTKEMHIYRDGVESTYLAGFTPADLTWTTITSTVNQVINVGRDPGDPTRMFDGRMDDVAWFNDVLTATERSAIRAQSVGDVQLLTGSGQANASGRLNSTTAGVPGKLIAYWNLDDAPGTTLVAGDGGTNIVLRLGPQTEGAQFVAGGGPTLPAGGPPLNAVVFDGDRDSIRVADSTSLDFAKSQGTISFWVRPDQLTVDNTSNGYIALVEDSNQQIFVGISRQTNAGAAFGNADFFGRIVFSPFENTAAANQNVVVSNTRLTAGQWTQVTVTWDFATRTASIYINGALDSTVVNNTTNPALWTQAAGNTGDWIFGADGKTQAHGLTGAMADVAVFGNALRASEVQSLYQTGAADSGSFDLAGARGRFTWDDDYVYGLIESYAAGPGTANGPFDNLELDLYINNGTTLAARLDSSVLVPVNNIIGSSLAPAGSDVQLYEFRIPRTAVNDGVQAFNPDAGDYLRYHLRTIDGDVSGSGFDTRDTTLGWVVEPPLTPDGLRRMDFAKSENFFGAGGRLTYTNFAHLELNAGDGVDTLTVVDSQIAPPTTNPTRTFTLNMGAGSDVVTIDSVDAAFASSITIDGQGDDDTVTINAALTLGSAVSDGNLTVTAETINLNAAVDTTAGLVGDVTFHVGTTMNIAAAGDVTAGGDVLIDDAGTLNTAGDVTTTGGNVTIETGTTLTGDVSIDSAGGNIAFSGAAALLDGAKPHARRRHGRYHVRRGGGFGRAARRHRHNGGPRRHVRRRLVRRIAHTFRRHRHDDLQRRRLADRSRRCGADHRHAVDRRQWANRRRLPRNAPDDGQYRDHRRRLTERLRVRRANHARATNGRPRTRTRRQHGDAALARRRGTRADRGRLLPIRRRRCGPSVRYVRRHGLRHRQLPHHHRGRRHEHAHRRHDHGRSLGRRSRRRRRSLEPQRRHVPGDSDVRARQPNFLPRLRRLRSHHGRRRRRHRHVRRRRHAPKRRAHHAELAGLQRHLRKRAADSRRPRVAGRPQRCRHFGRRRGRPAAIHRLRRSARRHGANVRPDGNRRRHDGRQRRGDHYRRYALAGSGRRRRHGRRRVVVHLRSDRRRRPRPNQGLRP